MTRLTPARKRATTVAALALSTLALPAFAEARPACGDDVPCPTPTPAVAAVGTFNGGNKPFVNVQATPSSTGTPIRRVRSGAKAFIVCQTTGTTAHGPYGTSNIWDQLQKGGYASDTRVYTGSDGRVAPDCTTGTPAPTPAPAADPFRYDDPAPWDGGANCSGGFTAGATVLRAWLQRTYPKTAGTIGGYACRQNTANPAQTSLHGVGRALDWMANVSDTGQRNAVNRFIARVSAKNFKLGRAMGIQELIWNRHIWTASRRSEGWRAYTGPIPHTDHIHIGINTLGATEQTSFYR
jgi:hypothetical protein